MAKCKQSPSRRGPRSLESLRRGGGGGGRAGASGHRESGGGGSRGRSGGVWGERKERGKKKKCTYRSRRRRERSIGQIRAAEVGDHYKGITRVWWALKQPSILPLRS